MQDLSSEERGFNTHETKEKKKATEQCKSLMRYMLKKKKKPKPIVKSRALLVQNTIHYTSNFENIFSM
jgi:hypothetical protein